MEDARFHNRPCYNGEQVIVETNRQLVATLERLEQIDFEIVYVDDGSRDTTPDILREIQAADSRARSLSCVNGLALTTNWKDREIPASKARN